MNRFLITALIIGSIAGCAGAAPAPASTPGPTAAPTNAAIAATTPAPTPRPTLAPTDAPTVSPEPTPEAPKELPVDSHVAPGQYFGEFEDYKFLVTVRDAGWTWTREYESFHYGHQHSDGAIFQPGGVITTLYAEACESEGTEFEFGPTVDDLVNALVTLEDFEVSDPTDVTLSGYQGTRVRVTVPMDADVGNPDCYEGYSLLPGLSYEVTGQTDDLWIIDMDGTRLISTVATGPDTPAQIVEQAEAMRDSLVLEPN